MNFDEWAKAVPLTITGDPLWKVEAYRLGLFAAEHEFHDSNHSLAYHDSTAATISWYHSRGWPIV